MSQTIRIFQQDAGTVGIAIEVGRTTWWGWGASVADAFDDVLGWLAVYAILPPSEFAALSEAYAAGLLFRTCDKDKAHALAVVSQHYGRQEDCNEENIIQAAWWLHYAPPPQMCWNAPACGTNPYVIQLSMAAAELAGSSTDVKTMRAAIEA